MMQGQRNRPWKKLETLVSLMQLWNEREIQILVLLSFMLQVFLFFFGGLRRRCTNIFLRIFIWLSYLGADTVAVYAIGVLSKHGDDTSRGAHQLAVLWATFLLIHIGGQDTITAFSMEDNQLWRRHLLNLVVQISVSLYVFWKSAAVHIQFLLPAIFLFIAGIIKYGERIWALKRGNPKAIVLKTKEEKLGQFRDIQGGGQRDGLTYPIMVWKAVGGMSGVRFRFAGYIGENTEPDSLFSSEEVVQWFKILEIELSLMYDDIYTKQFVILTCPGLILRCVIHIFTMIAFILFVSSDKKRYETADVTITYALFIGGFCLEVYAIFVFMSSPRVWAWLKSRKYNGLAHVAWHVLEVIQPETRMMWSNSIGQYNFLDSYFSEKPRPELLTKIIKLVGAEELWKKFWYTKHVPVTANIYKSIGEFNPRRSETWQLCKKDLFGEILQLPFETAILILHLFTDVWLHHCRKECRPVMMETCEQLSNYMFYLLVEHPSMLPVSRKVDELMREPFKVVESHVASKEAFLDDAGRDGEVRALFQDAEAMRNKEAVLEEVRNMWVALLCYAATRSDPELHAKQLSMGGELLTFLWLHMEHRFDGQASLHFHLVRKAGEPWKRCAFDLSEE